MIIEGIMGGAFNGLGKTIPQSITGITFNVLRIPMAIIFNHFYGLNGIWAAISFSSVLKGIVIVVWFKLYVRKSKLDQREDADLVIKDFSDETIYI